MSDRQTLERMTRMERQLRLSRSAAQPGIRLPYAPRVLNPFPLASSGGVSGDFPQSRAIVVLAFNVSVYVATTNTGGNYWTIDLINQSGATTIASVTTAALSPNTWTRLAAASITQPAASDIALSPRLTATGSPGAIYIVPEVIAG